MEQNSRCWGKVIEGCCVVLRGSDFVRPTIACDLTWKDNPPRRKWTADLLLTNSLLQQWSLAGQNQQGVGSTEGVVGVNTGPTLDLEHNRMVTEAPSTRMHFHLKTQTFCCVFMSHPHENNENDVSFSMKTQTFENDLQSGKIWKRNSIGVVWTGRN